MQKKIIKILATLPFLLGFSYLIRLPFSFGSINLQDILIFLFLIFSIFIIIKKRNYKKIKTLLKENLIKIILLILLNLSIIFSILANLNNKNILSSLGLYKSLFILPIIFAFIYKILKKEKILKTLNIFYAYFIYGSALSLLGIFYLFNNQLTFDHRLKIFFQSPNQFAMSLAVGIIIGIFLIKNNYKKRKFLVVLIISTFLQTVCLLFTKSAGAFLGLIMSIILFFVYNSKIIWKKIYFFLIILLTLSSFFLFFSNNLFKTSSWENTNIKPDSNHSRLAIYQVSSKINKDYFPFGICLGNFQEKYLQYQKFFPPYPQWAVPHAHNFWLYLSSETGFLGFLSITVLIFLTFYKSLTKKNPENMIRALLLVYFIIHSLADVPFVKNDLSLFFWVLIIL